MAWGTSVGLALGGIALVHAGFLAVGLPCFAVGTGILMLRGVATGPKLRRGYRGLAFLALALFMGNAAARTVVLLDPAVHLGIGVLAAQTYFIALDSRAVGGAARFGGRSLFAIAGHLMVTLGGLRLLDGTPRSTATAVDLLAAGFLALILETYWDCRSRRQRSTFGWETPLLVAGTAIVAYAAVLLLFVAEGSGASSAGLLPAATAIRVLLVMSVAIFASPPALPGRMHPLAESSLDMAIHGAVLASFLLALVALLAMAGSLAPVVAYGVLILWLVLTVFLEIAATVESFSPAARPARPAPPSGAFPTLPSAFPMTLVVASRNEGDLLRASVEENLRRLPGVPFLLVPSVSSWDETVAVARQFAARHPGRVRVLPGTGGSKADDLNLALAEVESEWALLLDSDEVVEEETLPYAIAVARGSATVGVVQGRKLPRGGTARFLDRFVAAERRFSTSVDHPFLSRRLKAAHFAGSLALVRVAAARSLGGWRGSMLTEDIDFAIRLTLAGRWSVEYEPRFVGWESNPLGLRGLLRQRGRWARGWMEVCFAHLGRLLRHPRRVGVRRALGFSWQLFAAVNAPLAILLPLLVALGLFGRISLGGWLGFALLGIVILLSRGTAYAVAFCRDPRNPSRRSVGRAAEAALIGYLWIPFSWMVQLHALYQELSAAERRWYATPKPKAEKAEPALMPPL